MPAFTAEYERAWAKRAKELGRDLTQDEATAVEGQLFQAWIDAGRLDELIRTVLARHGRDGGTVDIIVLGHHLRKVKDEARVHQFFGGLLSRRVKAFYQWWPRAIDGHIGCMREAARASAEAMDAYSEYFISLDALGLADEKELLREEMKRFQAREPVKKVLPQSRPRSASA
jgi:Xaa-Pro aminopeptidase